MDKFNEFQLLKRRFFAMRNGVVADALRKGGSPFRIIFGLNLPQLVEISDELGVRRDLAVRLWNNESTRESMLLAPMIYGPDNLNMDQAVEMAGASPSAEVADVLCHRLLRKTGFVKELALELAAGDKPMLRYCAMRLLWHFVYTEPDMVGPLAAAELSRGDGLTAQPARQIVEEVAFIRGDA